jgi:hypothetical protein
LALYKGQAAIREGKLQRGFAFLGRGLKEAEARGMRVDEAMILIALIEVGPSPERDRYLTRANELCRRLELKEFLARLAALEAFA